MQNLLDTFLLCSFNPKPHIFRLLSPFFLLCWEEFAIAVVVDWIVRTQKSKTFQRASNSKLCVNVCVCVWGGGL